MSQFEKNGLRETQKSSDGGLGIMDAFQGTFEDVLKDMRKAQCEFLHSKAAEDVLPKAEIQKDGKGEFLVFAAAVTDKKQQENLKDMDEWLDGKTRLRPQAA